MDTNNYQVVDKHFYQISGFKDDDRQDVINRSFQNIIFTDFESCVKLIKP